MSTKKTIITKQLWLDHPVYTEGNVLLTGLAPEDYALLDQALAELPTGRVLVSTSKKSGYHALSLTVIQQETKPQPLPPKPPRRPTVRKPAS